jgi:hypothetical protein
MQLACMFAPIVWACVVCLLLMPHGVCIRGVAHDWRGVALCGRVRVGQESRGVVGLSGTARVLRLCVAGNADSTLNRCFSTPPRYLESYGWCGGNSSGGLRCVKASHGYTDNKEVQQLCYSLHRPGDAAGGELPSVGRGLV